MMNSYKDVVMKGSDPVSTFFARRPVASALLFWFGMMVAYIVVGGVAQNLQLAATTRTMLFGAVLSVLGLIVVALQGSWRAVGLGAPTRRPGLILLTLPLLNLARGFHADLGTVALLVVASLLVGFNEELWFRGIILRVLQPKGQGWAVVGSALLFGVLHLLNGLAGQNLAVTLVQIAYACVLGLCFALVRLRTASLWPAALVHALTNLFAWTAQGGQIGGGSVDSLFDLLLPGVVIVLFGAYSLYLWRQMKETASVADRVA
jgi:membrane protease YdiL (CAAX protease family)